MSEHASLGVHMLNLAFLAIYELDCGALILGVDVQYEDVGVSSSWAYRWKANEPNLFGL